MSSAGFLWVDPERVAWETYRSPHELREERKRRQRGW